MPNLFVSERFTSHSGLMLPFKVECDALTDEDWKCLACIAHQELGLPEWYTTLGVPRGGWKFSFALDKFNNTNAKHFLVVDDVFTTGKAMEEARALIQKVNPLFTVIGVVAFARAKCPDWITPIWQLNPKLR